VGSDGTIDRERLQRTLDDIADTVEWGAGWIDYLEEHEVRVGTSDLAILKADLSRLRVVADAVLPDRIRDPRSGRRLYLAPDDVAQHARELMRALDEADRQVDEGAAEVETTRTAEKRRHEREERADAERAQREAAERSRVREFLLAQGPSTSAQIAAGVGLSTTAAEWAARSVATRGRRGRFAVPEGVAAPGDDDEQEEHELEEHEQDEEYAREEGDELEG